MNIFSIIICTHNPDPFIFKRLLRAIDNVQNIYPNSEVIIVDNNSAERLADSETVISFINKGSNRKLISEPKPGLTNARIAGGNISINPWVIFFDDDNEPEENYLSNLDSLINSYPEVGCWGAGKIDVQYTGKGNHQWLEKIKPYFQQRSLNEICISAGREWNEASPYGTGLIIKKDILNDYIKKVESGVYTLNDRSGRSLSSGGDIQIIFTAIAKGYKVGTAPALALNHLIKSEKTGLNYLCRLSYGTSSSYLSAYNQAFSDNPHRINTTSNYALLKLIYYVMRTAERPDRYKNFLLNLSHKMGEVNARYVCAPVLKKPFLLNMFERFIKYR